ncbi:MAG: hypothetical protein EBQ94_10730 [Flavobacteriales bacterium]|nr:hypothetical protein [Crocinitomicaceae bacterium]NBX80830.1 hypothetical protein [Flavobacteriales bacterium]NCA20659.1 hypothetical protein [Crocinitomicaceae bacterium]
MKHLVLLFSLLITSFTVCSQKITIELRLEKGKEYRHSIDSKIEMFEKKAGKTTKMNMVITGNIVYLVEKIKKDEMTIKTRYESLKMEFKTKDSEIIYDSENPGDEIMSKIFAEMKKTSFTILMNRQGKILKVDGEDKIFSKALDAFDDLTSEQKQSIVAEMSKSFGEDSFRGNFELITAIYPSVPVAIGDTWQTTTQLKSDRLSEDVGNDYTLNEVKPEAIIIEGNSEIIPKLDESKKDQILLKGTMTTYLRLDPKTNWMISCKVIQVMKGHYAKFQDEDKDNYIIFKTETSYSGSFSK